MGVTVDFIKNEVKKEIHGRQKGVNRAMWLGLF